MISEKCGLPEPPERAFLPLLVAEPRRALQRAMNITLPLDHAAIERILPHRYPFLLVDKITELEVDKRIVGVKNISHNDPSLSLGGEGALPPTILTEVIAQVGAILILIKPEDRQRLPCSPASSASGIAEPLDRATLSS